MDKENVGHLAEAAQNAQADLFKNECALLKRQIQVNEDQIKEYQTRLEGLQRGSGSQPLTVAVNLQDTFADKAGIPRPPPIPVTDGKDDSDFWTSISLEVSSSYSHEATETQSTSWSAGGSASWGLLSVGASASHSDSHSDASKQMANSSVKISFECMRVDIGRSWLRGELFYDHDLRVTAGELWVISGVSHPTLNLTRSLTCSVSPGPVKLAELMDPAKQVAMSDSDKLAREKDLERYDLFPMYPTGKPSSSTPPLGFRSPVSTHSFPPCGQCRA